MSQFTVKDYRIEKQSKTIPIHYEIKLTFKDKNPLRKGDLIANVPGDRWLVIKSMPKYVIIVDIEGDTEVRAMIGLWVMKGQLRIED